MKVIHRFKTYKGDEYKVIKQKTIKRDGFLCDGLCDPPDDDGALMRIQSDLKGEALIETIIHEMAHAFFFDKCETNVNRFAKSVMTFLRRMELFTQAKPNARSRSRSRASTSQTARLRNGRA